MTIPENKNIKRSTPGQTRRNSGKKLTITDIARLAGVSKKTVSRVINRSGQVKDDTREKILRVVEEHGYVPDPQARALALRRSELIALIWDQPNPSYAVDMQLGILEGLAPTQYQLVIRPCDRSLRSLHNDICDLVQHQKFFGVILTPSISEDDKLADRLRQIECPYVRIAAVSLDSPENMIETHDYVGASRSRAPYCQPGPSAYRAYPWPEHLPVIQRKVAGLPHRAGRAWSDHIEAVPVAWRLHFRIGFEMRRAITLPAKTANGRFRR